MKLRTEYKSWLRGLIFNYPEKESVIKMKISIFVLLAVTLFCSTATAEFVVTWETEEQLQTRCYYSDTEYGLQANCVNREGVFEISLYGKVFESYVEACHFAKEAPMCIGGTTSCVSNIKISKLIVNK